MKPRHQENSSHWIYGFHAVMAALKSSPEQIQQLCVDRDRHDKRMKQLYELAKRKQVRIDQVQKEFFQETLGDVSHQGVMAAFEGYRTFDEADFFQHLAEDEAQLVLILDGVQDPHNLGACIRTANAAGVKWVIAPKDKAVGLTPVAQKVASGALEMTHFIQVTNLARVMERLKEMNFWLVGLAGEADQPIYDYDFKGNIAIIMGAEGKGLRRLTRDLCDSLVYIPMQGTVSSVNVSVATGVALFEATRQRSL